MSQAPTIRGVDELPRLQAGDVIKTGSQVLQVVGSELGKQSLRETTISDGYNGRIIPASPAAIARFPVLPGMGVSKPLATSDVEAQISAILGQTFPPPQKCDALAENDQKMAIKLRDALSAKLEEMIKSLSALDPVNQKAAIAAFTAMKQQQDQILVASLSTAAAVANAIPVVGQVLSALISLVLAISHETASVGPPQVTPIRESFELNSYRGFSAGLWNLERPIGEMPTYADVERAITRRQLGFIAEVDQALDTLTQAFHVQFACLFPRWFNGSSKTVPQLLYIRDLAERYKADPETFKAKAYLDPGKPRFLFEALPSYKSEGIQALVKGQPELGMEAYTKLLEMQMKGKA
jgi:hypothetical protein